MQYKLHLNLRQRAALKTAISFWEKKEVKDKIIECFESNNKSKASKVKEEYRKQTKIVLEILKKDIIPQTLEVELIHLVKMTGETIFNWYQYIKHEYKATTETISFIDQIYWTPYGTLDEVQTFESSLLKNPKLDTTKVYYFACSLALEKHINDLWNEIPLDIRNKYFVGSYMRFDRHIQAYWNHRMDKNLSNLMSIFEIIVNIFNKRNRDIYYLLYDLSSSTEENMFWLSVHQGYFIAAKYFWEKLEEEKKDESVLECARIAVSRYNYYINKDEGIGDYKKSQYVEICIFLMNQMSKNDKKLFFNEEIDFDETYLDYMYRIDVKDGILRMLLSTWPWQELFMPVLKDMLKYQDDDSIMKCMFLDDITYKMIEDYKLGYSIETSRYRSLFREAWLIIPGSIKQKLVEEGSDYEFICNLIDMWDFDSLKLILNDPAIANVRDKFIDFGLYSYKQFVLDDQFEKLDQLIEKIFKSEDEKKSFRQKINPWYDILKDHKFDLADKLLDWQSITPEERLSLKNNIDHMKFCEEFIEIYCYDLFDKFLDWKFETEEEKIICESHFKNDIFVIRQVYDIWKWSRRHTDDAKHESSRFLIWVLESNEKIKRFKKEKLVNLEIDTLTIHNLIMLNKDSNIDDFLSWCLLDDKEVQRIKQAIARFNVRI